MTDCAATISVVAGTITTSNSSGISLRIRLFGVYSAPRRSTIVPSTIPQSTASRVAESAFATVDVIRSVDTVQKNGLATPAGEALSRELRLGLPSRLLGRVVAFDAVDSTNLYARDQNAALADDAILLADAQRAGRGRMSRSWYSERGSSLLVSMVKALLPVAAHNRLYPLSVAVAVSESIEKVCRVQPIDIKWPNDLQFEGAKCAGILIGSVSASRCVVGIGINVGEMVFPEDLAGKATTLSTIAGRSVSRMAVLAELVDAVDRRIVQVSTEEGRADIFTSYTRRLAHVGETVTMHRGDGHDSIAGELIGIQSDGAVIIRTATGDRTFHAGDVTTNPVPGRTVT